MRQLFAAMGAVLMLGCTPTFPYRTDLSSLPENVARHCAQKQGQPAPGPGTSSHQRLSLEGVDYADLFFVEFDDQGLLYPGQGTDYKPEFGRASCHIEALMAGLESLAQTDGLSIIVYVHGWKHNAEASDRDVEKFKELLADAWMVERAKAERAKESRPHRVVGVYVSWRGKSLDLPEPLISLTFWDRKNTAQHVAQGETRALFARLRAFQTEQNSAAQGFKLTSAEAQKLPFREKKVLLILIGHSFGGLIIYNSVAQSLVNSMYEASRDAQDKKVFARFADMIVIANPAFEALRYTPLHRAAERITFEEYQTPVFVSITSEADWATKYAFPAGRYLSTVFQNHASDEEREANRRTMGHMPRYITHQLEPAGKAMCPGWVMPEDGSLLPLPVARKNLELEIGHAKVFFANAPAGPKWSRTFCGDTLLKHTGGHPYSPIWNISTTGQLVSGHNDITKPVFINFVRQLYHDVILSDVVNPKNP